MPSPHNRSPNNLFLSQAIPHRPMSPPVLIPPKDTEGYDPSNNPEQEKVIAKPVAWQWNIDACLIPSLNIYYMLEPTSITIKNTPIHVVESRLATFLRVQSIAYQYDAAAVCLHCVTANTLKFVVQFWRVGDKKHLEDPNRALTLELQRRNGSAVEMQSIRRKMFKALITGEQGIPDGQKPRQLSLPDTIMTEVSTGYNQDEGLVDAMEIALRLMESQCIDQRGLGLESLRMLTDATIVSHRDALLVSRGIIFQEGQFGPRLQTSLGNFFGIARHNNVEEEENIGHGVALSLLAGALQSVTENISHSSITGSPTNADVNNNFWRCVSEDLSRNVERAIEKPHEAAKSAKCLRLIHGLEGSLGAAEVVPVIRGPAWRSCLAQAHRYGKHCHLSLERESQKLLAMDTENFVRAH